MFFPLPSPQAPVPSLHVLPLPISQRDAPGLHLGAKAHFSPQHLYQGAPGRGQGDALHRALSQLREHLQGEGVLCVTAGLQLQYETLSV